MGFLTSDVTIALVRSLGLLALVSMTYSGILRHVRKERLRSPLVGLLFGAGAVLSMTDPTHILPGIIVDARTVIIGLAAPFGGVPAAVVAALCAAGYRLWLGGAGAWMGMVGIATAALAGMLFTVIIRRQDGGFSARQLLLLAGVTALSLLNVLLLPWNLAARVLAKGGLVVAITHLVGVWVLGSFLSGERTRIQNEIRHRQTALTDWLTGLANRRAFDEASRRAFLEARRRDGPLSVLLVDCDRFKEINHGFGHDAGDQALIEAARVMKESAQDAEVVARYGGEEFAILLSSTPSDGARMMAERLRSTIAGTRVDNCGGELHLTVSIGVASLTPEMQDVDEVVHAADQQLYRAKTHGRNRVEAASAIQIHRTENG